MRSTSRPGALKRLGANRMDDATEFLALRIEYPYPARTAAIDVAGAVNLHAVRHAGLGAAGASL
jgi:hypothetical protein